MKHPGKFFPLNIDFGTSGADDMPEYDITKTSLKKEIAELVELLIDIKAMQRTLRELEVDTSKMPLGKLTRGILRSFLLFNPRRTFARCLLGSDEDSELALRAGPKAIQTSR